MNPGRLVVLSGPSGVGKDTVIDRWRKANPNVQRVVSFTTRDPRPGEQDGIDYRFVSRDDFLQRAQAGNFLEYKEVYGNFYATPLADLEEMLNSGAIAVLKIDVQGALTVMELREDALSVFLLPPDRSELIRRIKDRGTEEGAVLDRRIEKAQAEMDLADHYKFQVVNDNIDQAVRELQEIVNG